MMPEWLRHLDPDYSPFDRAEVDRLYDLRRAWKRQGTDDRFHAGVPLLRDDGAAIMVPLTIDLVEPHAHRYWDHRANESFTLTPRNGEDYG